MTLVVGVPDSGKSALAEKLVLEQSGDGKRIYLATMIPYGKDGAERVKKHRNLREGKGFFTIEEPVNVSKAVIGVEGIEGSTCLLECISNLVGNVMHDDALILDNGAGGSTVSSENQHHGKKDIDEWIISKVMTDIEKLAGTCRNLVVVTNSFPGDNEEYDEDTRRYVRLVDEINARLSRSADVIYEFTKGEWVKHECD